MSEKTEQPTPRRLQRARELGDTPVSGALVSAGGLLGMVALIGWTVRSTSARFHVLFTEALSGRGTPETLWAVVWLALPLLATGAAVSLMVGLFQTRGVFALKRTQASLTRLSLGEGLKHSFNGPQLFALVRALVAALCIGLFAAMLLRRRASALLGGVGDVGESAVQTGSLAMDVLWLSVAVCLALGAVDAVLSHAHWKKRLKMTARERRDEQKETSGDPAVREARNAARRTLWRQASPDDVQAARLVVTGRAGAVALRLTGGGRPPIVVAKGPGGVTGALARAARLRNVPLVHDSALLALLLRAEPGEPLAPSLYDRVAGHLRDTE